MSLEERFGALELRGEGDWGDVLARAGGPRRARRTLLLAAAVAAAIVVPTAVALRGHVLDFVRADPAPERVERDFESFNEGLTGRMSPDVIGGETRKIIDIPAPRGKRAILWVAPREDGGFCWIASRVSTTGGGRETGVGGCGGRAGGRMHAHAAVYLQTPQGRILGGIDVMGRVRDPAIVRLELHHADGAVVELPFVRVSDPIGVGFFLYPVPLARLNEGRPTEVVALDGDGRVVKRESLPIGPPR